MTQVCLTTTPPPSLPPLPHCLIVYTLSRHQHALKVTVIHPLSHCLTLQVVQVLINIPSHDTITHTTPTRLVGHPLAAALAALSAAIARARQSAPSLLLLDDLDVLCPAPTEEVTPLGLSF